ncbi:MAG: hypothetical protein KDC24_12935 [Saprospiraceae bacterium]|nr:hypothetical protein [Saprospiraceae bacterium]
MKRLFLVLTAIVIISLDLAAIMDIWSQIETNYTAEIVLLGLSIPLLYALSIMWGKPSKTHL